MNIKIKELFATLFIGMPMFISAQHTTSEPFLEMPDWMKQVMNNSEGVNYYEFVKKYEDFKQSLPNNGKKTPYNKAVLNAYKWWQRTYSPFVGTDSLIHLPNQQQYNLFLQRENHKTNAMLKSVRRHATSPDSWKVIAPMMTYDFKTKRKVPWQSNVQRLDASDSNPDIIYAGTDTGMMFKSTNKGKTWIACAPMMSFGGAISSVEVSATDPNKVLVASVHNLWLTTDGGLTWKNITPLSPTIGVYVRDAVFYGQNDDIIIAGTDRGVYKSINNGEKWSTLLSGRCFDIKVQPIDNHPKVYALLDEAGDYSSWINLYVSDQQVKTFHKKQISTSNLPFVSGRLAVNPNAPNYIYAIACSNDYGGMPFFRGKPYILKSTNEGETFEFNPVYQHMNPMDYQGGQGYYDMVIASQPNDPEKIFFGLLFLYSSSNGGKTIDLHQQNYPEKSNQLIPNIGGYFGKYDLHTDMQDIDIARDGTIWLATDGGISYSNDYLQTHPEVRMDGIYASEFWGFDQGWNEDVIVGGRNHNGDMVQNIATYEGHSIAMRGSENPTGYIFLSNPRKITFSDTQQKMLIPDKWDGIFKDFDGADKFHVWPLEHSLHGFRFLHDPRYAKCFYVVTNSLFGKRDATDHMLWRTTDDGLSYTLVKEFDTKITGYAISRSNPNKLVVGLMGKLVYTTDAGQTWHDLPLGKNMDFANYRIEIHPTNENEIWFTNYEDGGMYQTTDNGQHWIQRNEGLSLPSISGNNKEFFISHFFITGNNKDAVYAIANGQYDYDGNYIRYQGRLVYFDGEKNKWIDYSEGLPALMRINQIKPFYKEGKIRIATDNGVWERSLVNKQFKPIAQPIILNVGSDNEVGVTELQLDSYSIANQNHVKWHWDIQPKPLRIDNENIRNPKITIDPQQSYNISLTVTNTIDGKEYSDTKTITNMIHRSKPVPDVTGIEQINRLAPSASLTPSLIKQQEPLRVHITKELKDVSLLIYDMKGTLLYQAKVKDGETIQPHTLPAGVCVYRFTAPQYQKVGKLLVQ